MIMVAETPTSTKQADDLFDEEEKQDLISFLSKDPLEGDVISGTGGVRKLRYAASGRGKRGGARVIYYYFDESLPLYGLLVYPKNAKTDLTADDKRAALAFVEALKATRRKL